MPQEQEKAIKSLIQTIKSSQKTLDIAIYSFTNREISKAIRDTAKKGAMITPLSAILPNSKISKLAF